MYQSMNNVFKSVWNAAVEVGVAVAKFEGSRGKGVRNSVNSQCAGSNPCYLSAECFVLILLVLCMLFALRSGAAMAQQAPSPCIFDHSGQSVVCGAGAVAGGEAPQNAIAIGFNAQALNPGDIVIGAGAEMRDRSGGWFNGNDKHNSIVGAGSTAVGIGHTVLGADNSVDVSANSDVIVGTVVAGRFNVVNSHNANVIGNNNQVLEKTSGPGTSAESNVHGNKNIVSGSVFANIMGVSNTVKDSETPTVLGDKNELADSSWGIVLGRFNKLSDSGFNLISGYANTLKNAAGHEGKGLVETSNSISGAQNKLDTVKGSTHILGDGNTITSLKTDGTEVSGASFSKVEIVGSGNTLKAESAGSRTRISVLGSNNTLNGEATDAVVIGSKNKIAGNFTGTQVLGSDVRVSDDASDSVAIGRNTRLSAPMAVALGLGAKASVANSVALGAWSVADAPPVAVDKVSINGITYGGFAGVAQPPSDEWPEGSGIVSVGDESYERQVTHVASGRITADSTDATNGSQLFATNTVLGNVADSTATILGGDAKVDPATGNLSTSDIGRTGQNTVHNAIADVRAKRSEVVQGDGIVVTPVTIDDKTTYTVELSDAVKGELATVSQVGRTLNQIDGKVEQYRKDARGGTAAAMAMAGLPQAYLPGKSMFAIGGSSFQGQRGYAAGLSTVSANGNWVVKGSVAGSDRGQFGGAVGIGYQW